MWILIYIHISKNRGWEIYIMPPYIFSGGGKRYTAPPPYLFRGGRPPLPPPIPTPL